VPPARRARQPRCAAGPSGPITGRCCASSTSTRWCALGDRDTYSDSAVTAELTASLRRPRLVVLRAVGHLPNLERPERLNAELRQFLADATAGPAPQP